MGQYYFACWRLPSVVVVCDAAGGRAGRRAGRRSGGRHCTAGQYGYVPLGRHLVIIIIVIIIIIIINAKIIVTLSRKKRYRDTVQSEPINHVCINLAHT